MEQQPALLWMPAKQEPSPPPAAALSALRIHRAARGQIELIPRDPEELVPEEHPARAIWAFLERLDLDAFYAGIRAAIDRPGRPASDPRVLLALWVLATVDGVGSARRLARLCETDDVYRWLRGRVPLNYHLLSDFRVANLAALDELLTQTVAVLMRERLVTLRRVAQDGLRVRASAGSGSFRRRESLEGCLQAAREQVQRLAREREQPDSGVSRRQRAARERAARERLERVERALAELPAVEAIKERQKKQLAKEKRERVSEARVSTSDPQARVMKQADGGFRPAVNVQLATDLDSRLIVGLAVSQQGADAGLAAPLEAMVAERIGEHPEVYLVDGGLVTRDDVTTLAERGVTVYGPVEPPRTTTSGRVSGYEPRPDDSPAVRAWRERMATEEAKTIYRQRAATAEWTNAQWRARQGLRQFTVRGLEKITTVALLHAVTHNLLRWQALGM